MRKLGIGLSLLAVAVAPATAQVTVEITQDQDQFLPGEELLTAVRITNRSGQTLRLGAEQDWLTFTVQGQQSEVVPVIADVPVVEEFTLDSSRVATKRVDLAPYFALTHSGSYTVTATVRIKQWNRTITSEPHHFNIIEGARLWEQNVGVPESGGATNAMPEIRKYILQQANYLKSQLRLYVRLTDVSGAKTLRVLPIGPVVSFGRPEPLVDQVSNLHLLYQDGAHSFCYTVINPQGEIITRQTYDCVDKRPRLQVDKEGKIQVIGGIRRDTENDLPPSKTTKPAEAGPKPMPSPGELMPPSF